MIITKLRHFERIELNSIRAYTIFLRSSDPIFIVTYYIKWVTTSWTNGSCLRSGHFQVVLTVDSGLQIKKTTPDP